MKHKIMYMETKGAEHQGDARVGRITQTTFSRVIHYRGKQYQPHKDKSVHANYYEVGTGAWYWITHCQKDGMDSLEPCTVNIDEDARQEYWEKIRKSPDKASQTQYQSPGKGRA